MGFVAHAELAKLIEDTAALVIRNQRQDERLDRLEDMVQQLNQTVQRLSRHYNSSVVDDGRTRINRQGNLERIPLRQTISRYFSEDELKDLAVDVGVNYDDLPASTLSGKARELIEYVRRRHGHIEPLLRALQMKRSHIDWTEY